MSKIHKTISAWSLGCGHGPPTRAMINRASRIAGTCAEPQHGEGSGGIQKRELTRPCFAVAFQLFRGRLLQRALPGKFGDYTGCSAEHTKLMRSSKVHT